MLLLDRRSAPFFAVGAALVVLAGGLVAVGVWWATNCFGGWVGRPLAADMPAAVSGPDRADVAAAGDLRAVGVDATQIILAAQDGRDSVLRSLDTATGAERWRVGYEAHDSTLRPVTAGGVVAAYVVPADGGPSALQAFDVAIGEPRWTAAVDPPGDLEGDVDTLTVAEPYGAGRGVEAIDPRSGVRRWATPLPGNGSIELWPVDGGVLVNAQSLTRLDAGTGAARWTAAAVEPAPVGLAPAIVGGQFLVPRYRGVDAVDLATGTTASAADTDVLSASQAAVVAHRAERVTVLVPG